MRLRQSGVIVGMVLLSVVLSARCYGQPQQPAAEPFPPMPPMLPIAPVTQPSAVSSSSPLYRPMGVNTAAPLLPYDYKNPTIDGASPTATTQVAWVPREGTYLSRRPGKLSRTADGKGWQFAPDPRMADALNVPVLTVAPSSALGSMERMLGTAAEGRFAVSGTITSYNLQPYIVIDIAAPTEGPATLAAEKTAAPAPIPATRPSATRPADQMLNDMLGSGARGNPTGRPLSPSTAPARDATSGGAAVAPGAANMTVLREGTFLVDRTGRLTRGADGQSWEFTFEADGRTMRDPPVLILPNLKLMSMEQAAKGSSRDLRFRVTGMVTEYNGRNYVLLEKVLVVPEITQQF